MSIHVVAPGLLSTVQDLGRAGYQCLGVPVGGAMDAFAARVANLLVGNHEGAAVLELTLAGAALRFDEDALIAVAGADLGARSDGGAEIAPWRPARVPSGETVEFQEARAGCRAYLAIAGGVVAPEVLGSRSTFTRASLGGLEGRALRAGDVLATGAATPLAAGIAREIARACGRGGGVAVARWGAGPSLRPPYSARPVVYLLAGTHVSELTSAARCRLFEAEFTLSPNSDRAGYRLDGPSLELGAPLEILSEAVAFGTVQLPPDGRPIVLMADRQPTGGYPRIGEVASVDLPLLAQLRPGDRVRFREGTLAEAQRRYLAREQDLARLRAAISLHHP